MITSKSNFFKGAVATLAAIPLAAAVTFTPAGSAQAARLSGSISLTGEAIIPSEINPATTTFTFKNVTGVNTGGDFTNFFPVLSPGAGITINTLNLTRIGDGKSELGTYSTTPNFEFINFGSRTLGATTAALTFVLDAAELSRTRLFETPSVSITSLSGITGKFMFDGETISSGFVNASVSGGSSGYQLTLDTVAVPEPATLLGLGVVAAGMAVSRRRKTIPQ
ncbi:MAG: PEP-CTERM sorting domain-containing protein [Nodularia sp. (in: Bacteria)]|nr:MAG: PEP-CTERM sorting domain-containing protein [Nodularia sp. (in: cyanobacteria)]